LFFRLFIYYLGNPSVGHYSVLGSDISVRTANGKSRVIFGYRIYGQPVVHLDINWGERLRFCGRLAN